MNEYVFVWVWKTTYTSIEEQVHVLQWVLNIHIVTAVYRFDLLEQFIVFVFQFCHSRSFCNCILFDFYSKRIGTTKRTETNATSCANERLCVQWTNAILSLSLPSPVPLSETREKCSINSRRTNCPREKRKMKARHPLYPAYAKRDNKSWWMHLVPLQFEIRLYRGCVGHVPCLHNTQTLFLIISSDLQFSWRVGDWLSQRLRRTNTFSRSFYCLSFFTRIANGPQCQFIIENRSE